MSELILNSTNFHKEIKESNVPVLVDFYADWCGPCKMMSPIIEELATDYKGKANVFKLNVDEAREIASEYKITSIPTVMIFKDGEKVEEFIGAMPKNRLEDHLNKHMQ
ncbi:MAG: thioredoxin [Spirochaetes bacterium]|nr:thioredoxin [Spirochaetota bacterium]